METCYELETFKVRLTVSEPPSKKARHSEEAAAIMRPIYADLDADQEHFTVLLLDNKNKLRGFKILSSGSQTASLVHPIMVFRAAVLFGAMAIVIGHNHPAGDPEPSPEDFEITRRIKECADLFGIRLLDHIVLGDGRYYSFSDRGTLGHSSPGAPLPIKPKKKEKNIKARASTAKNGAVVGVEKG